MLVELRCENFVCKSINIHCDNQAAIQWLKNAKSSSKTRHVNLKLHFVRDEVENYNITMVYIDTKEMIADFFTKGIQKEKFYWCCNQMLLK